MKLYDRTEIKAQRGLYSYQNLINSADVSDIHTLANMIEALSLRVALLERHLDTPRPSYSTDAE
jgi:hypothetical protein